MDINNNISIIQKKPRGRPKKVIDETIEIKLPNPNGRPKKYLTDEELKQAKRLNSKNDYERRGFLYAKIKSLKIFCCVKILLYSFTSVLINSNNKVKYLTSSFVK